MRIQIDAEVTPKFCKAWPVPYAMKEKVEKKLDRMLGEGILDPVEFAEWEAPIVSVMKPNNSVRICGDFCMTINQAMTLDQYLTPKIENLLTLLAGGKSFTKLDLSQAYLQLPLDRESRKLAAININTQKGLFCYTRMPFWNFFSTGYIPEKYGQLNSGH